MPFALASNWPRKASKLPKNSSIAAPSSPSGLSPPSGDMFGQNTEWLMCPPRWKARSFSSLLMLPYELPARASASCSRAVFTPLT